MTHLLDTDTCVAVLRQRPGYLDQLRRLAPADVAVSMVTVYELYCGVEKTRDPAAERQKVAKLLAMVNELPFDRSAAEAAARIRADLAQRGQIIGPYDLLIAGHAVAHRLTLVTDNVAEFRRVTGLQVESWSAAGR